MKDLRQHMIEDMKLRGLAPGTQERYLHTITALAKHYHRRPDELTQEQVRNYLLYLIETKKYAKSTLNVNLFAIKFLYQKTLGREWRFQQLKRVKTNRRLPIVLSRDEVWSLLDQVRRPKVRMSLTLMYTCGLRVSEAVNLRLEDIDSRRKVVWVRNGKGYKDRSVPLPTQTLAQLRAYPRQPGLDSCVRRTTSRLGIATLIPYNTVSYCLRHCLVICIENLQLKLLPTLYAYRRKDI